MARFLRRAGVIPVYRRQDDPDKMDRNTETFTAVLDALAAGRLVAIYPEGTTHAETRVQRIKTGAARIALAYEARRREGGPGAELAVIPVGLSFEARKSFKSRVLVAFGAPVPVLPHVEPYRDDPVKAVDALTTRIQWAMESQVIHAERVDAARLVQAVQELYGDALARQLEEERGVARAAIDPLRLARAIGEAVTHFRVHDPARVEDIWHRIQTYRAALASHRLRDDAVRAYLARPPVARRLRTSGLALLGLPVFAYGAAVNALPYYVPRFVSHRLARKETDYATVRLLTSIVAFPLFWGLETWLVWRVAGPGWALAFAASLPVAGVLAYHYLVGLGRLRGQWRFSMLALGQRQDAQRLLAERQAIVAELERARNDYAATTRSDMG
jgi:hypothetical protein